MRRFGSYLVAWLLASSGLVAQAPGTGWNARDTAALQALAWGAVLAPESSGASRARPAVLLMARRLGPSDRAMPPLHPRSWLRDAQTRGWVSGICGLPARGCRLTPELTLVAIGELTYVAPDTADLAASIYGLWRCRAPRRADRAVRQRLTSGVLPSPSAMAPWTGGFQTRSLRFVRGPAGWERRASPVLGRVLDAVCR